MIFSKVYRIKAQMAIVLLVIGAGVGWLFAVQFKTAPSRVLNPVTPFLGLTQAQATLTRDQEETKKRIKELRDEIKNQHIKLKRRRRSTKVLVEDVEKYKQEVGLTEQKGVGLVITLADSSGENPTIDSIVHAADLRDVVNLLWLSGARAISVNDQRLVANSSIDSIINTILVNNTKITNPFVIRAIGNYRKLSQAIQADDRLVDIKKRVGEQGLVFNVEKSADVSVVEYGSSLVINQAKIR